MLKWNVVIRTVADFYIGLFKIDKYLPHCFNSDVSFWNVVLLNEKNNEPITRAVKNLYSCELKNTHFFY